MRYLKLLSAITVLAAALLLYNIYGTQSDATSQARAGSGATLQPIAFSHKVHAGENQIPCQYCHYNARKADHPAVPSVRACMGCHTYIPGTVDDYDYEGTKISFKDEIGKLKQHWQDKTPIPWVKLHFVPQHAHFKHKPHIRAGLDCAECHGNVQEMDLAKPVNVIEMGFCIDCHRTREETLAVQEQKVLEGKELVYLRDCATCHY